jgi:hypothetical protein
MPRSLSAVLTVALAAAIPGVARAQASPSLSFDKPCYAEGDAMGFSGAGYTPNGEVDFIFNQLETQKAGTFQTHADGAGAIAGTIDAPSPDDFLRDDDVSGVMGAAATDRTRADQGAPPNQQFAGTVFTLTRWDVQVSRRNGRAPRAAQPMRVAAYGFTRVIGETLYLHYRRGGKTRKTVKIGRLGGDCGNRTRTLPRGLPRGLPPGRYQLVFNTSATSLLGERVWFTQRLR